MISIKSIRISTQLTYSTLLILFTLPCIAQIPHLDVEGHVKLRGNVDMNHSFDSTSLSIGKDAGLVGGIFTSSNLYLGVAAGANIGNNNSFYGWGAGGENSGIRNTFFGFGAGFENKGDNNVFFGTIAGINNDMGEGNSFFGIAVGAANRSGSSNSFFGANAGGFLKVGDHNTYFGSFAGSAATSGTRNTYIGAIADQLNSADSLDRAIAIGHQAKVDCNNCAAIGGTGADAINLGIGLTNPETRLHIRHGNLRVDNGSFESNGPIIFHPDVDLTGDDFILFFNSVGAEIARFDNDEFLGIGTNDPNDALDIVGDLDATGCIQIGNTGSIGGTCISDIRFKKNIVDLRPQLKRLLALHPVRYNWQSQFNDRKQYIGLIAQEVEQVFDDMVITDAQGFKRIQYDNTFQIRLVKGIQEQQEIINVQVNKMDRLKQNLESLKVELMKQIVNSLTAGLKPY